MQVSGFSIAVSYLSVLCPLVFVGGGEGGSGDIVSGEAPDRVCPELIREVLSSMNGEEHGW